MGTPKTSGILGEILESVRGALQVESSKIPLDELRSLARDASPPRDFQAALTRGEPPRIIAETKGASPSAGTLAKAYEPVPLAQAYQEGGAVALSVLTEPKYFRGALSHLSAVREATGLPVLRKDFLVDPYQLYQARAAGADAVLLIVRCLEDGPLQEFLGLAEDLGMSALVEAYDEGEVDRAVSAGARIIGINQRDLKTFETDPISALKLSARLPPSCIGVAESGIKTRNDIKRLMVGGFECFLVGETLIRSRDPARKIRELRGAG